MTLHRISLLNVGDNMLMVDSISFLVMLLSDKAGAKVGQNHLGSLTSDQAKNGLANPNHSTFAPISQRLA